MSLKTDYMDEEEYTESLEIFLEDLERAYGDSEYHLLKLGSDPGNAGLISSVFRTIHTLKGGLAYIDVTEFTPMLHAIEDILEALREKRLPYDTVMDDLILLVMDLSRVEVMSRLRKGKGAINKKHIDDIVGVLKLVATASSESYKDLVREAVILMDPETALSASRMHEDEVVDGIESLLLAYGIVIDEDMQFFIRQAYAIDERSHYWRGRCERVLKNCLELNENLGLELAQDQLAVAVLMHDVGMAFLPIDVLHKAGELTAQEKALVSSHTQVGRQLISGMSRWQSAAEIIYQHHEHYNGKGYPQGLCADEICAGAKILSIADAFEACTHDRAYITRIKRPALRALLILNHGAGEQFDKKYVQSFAAMVEQSAKD